MKKFGLLKRMKKLFTPFLATEKNITLGEFTMEYAYRRQKEGETKNAGRCGTVLSLATHLKKAGVDRIPLEMINVALCIQIIEYFHQARDMRRNVKNPQKLAKGTIITRVRTLKAVLQEAVKMGYMEKNPMALVPSTYHIKPIRNERYALTEEELAILQASRCHTPELKDAFMFCCLTGLRKSDALSLRPADIQEYDGTYYIHKVMKKTQTLLHIPLSEEALEILKQKYEDGASPFFSHLSPYHLNQHLKTWLSENGIDSKPITFHSSRHTCATLLLNMQTDMFTISHILGHHSIATTQLYIHVTTQKEETALHQLGKKLHPCFTHSMQPC